MKDEDPIKPQEVEIEKEIPKEPVTMTVDLEKKEEKKEDEIKKLRAQIEYEARKREKLTRQITEMNQYLSSLQRPQPQPQEEPIEKDTDWDEEADRLAQTNWQKGVREITRKEGKKLVVEALKEIEEQKEAERRAQLDEAIRNKSKQKVTEEFPDLNDPYSENSQLYRECLKEESEEDPAIFINPRGPEIVLKRMKEKMKEKGVLAPSEREFVGEKVDEEVKRRMRTQGTQVPASRPSSGQGKVVLTQEEIEYAQAQGIPFERYALMKKNGEKSFRQGVTVS